MTERSQFNYLMNIAENGTEKEKKILLKILIREKERRKALRKKAKKKIG